MNVAASQNLEIAFAKFYSVGLDYSPNQPVL